jgi:catechol 2,3-dioxygenase-like lactoylglutathione lyase family enzyme
MLSQSTITPVVHVANIDRARKYYSEVLGLKEEGRNEAGNLAFGTSRGFHLELMVKPEAVSREATVLTFEVDDVEREVSELTSRGARFERVEIPGAKTQGNIAIMGRERAAWFKDSEGNWLCVHDQRPRA